MCVFVCSFGVLLFLYCDVCLGVGWQDCLSVTHPRFCQGSSSSIRVIAKCSISIFHFPFSISNLTFGIWNLAFTVECVFHTRAANGLTLRPCVCCILSCIWFVQNRRWCSSAVTSSASGVPWTQCAHGMCVESV